MPTDSPNRILPPGGRSKEEVLAAMRAARDHDLRWQDGRVFSLVYDPGQDVLDLSKEAYTMFFSENGLNPSAFPSLRRFETEVVAMVAGLLGGGPDACGSMTSGGTESLLMAVYAAREWARATHPEITAPEMVLPSTAHPALDKAGHYFGVRVVRVPVGTDFCADVSAVQSAVTPSTILLVGSAPSYPHGVLDPIAGMGEIAARHGILFHVDACVGGMILPFARRLGREIPPFDLSVPGVTSISADLHKYGYTAKGASTIIFRTAELRRHMFFASTDWPGGVYASPALAGTRPGGAIAAAWAVMNFLGEDGYLALTRTVLNTTNAIREGIDRIPGLRVLGSPVASILAIGPDGLDIYEVADEMTARGWHLDRQHLPPCLHLTIHPGHAPVTTRLLADLAESARRARRPGIRRAVNHLLLSTAQAAAKILPERWISALTAKAGSLAAGGGDLPGRSAAMYGLIGTLPNRGDLKELVLDLLDKMTRPSTSQEKS